jgi:hypothetical protein
VRAKKSSNYQQEKSFGKPQIERILGELLIVIYVNSF